MDPSEFVMALPPEHLRPFLRRYLYAAHRIDGPIDIRPKPTGYIYFANVMEQDAGDHVVVDGRHGSLHSRWHFAGQIVDHDIVVHLERGDRVIFCEFTATGLHRLFGLPGDSFVGAAPALSDMRPDLEPLARACFVAGPSAPREEHVAEANAFFTRLAGTALPADAEVERAVAMLEAANGAVRVAAICREVGLSPRQLNRRFTRIVGVGPKFFGQVLQINWVVGLLYSDDTASLTAIAHDAGFYDQAHFNRAMRQFFQAGPREFLQSKHLLFKHFLGASRRFGPSADHGP